MVTPCIIWKNNNILEFAKSTHTVYCALTICLRKIPFWTISTGIISFKWHQLPIRLLATYLYLTVIFISIARCEYEYAASIASLAWALTKEASDREGAFDMGGSWRDTWPGLMTYLHHGVMVGHRSIATEQHFCWCLFKLLLAKNI